MNSVKFKAPGSGNVIQSMISLFTSYASKYEFGDSEVTYQKFIEELTEELGVERNIAVRHFQSRFDGLQKGKVEDPSFYFMMAISSILESFQSKIVLRLSLRLKRKFPSKTKKEILEYIEMLAQTSNRTFSLLINIEILKEMSRLTGVSMKPILTDEIEIELLRGFK